MRRVRLMLVGTLALSSVGTAHAFGDAERGRDIAERWCTSCHVVASDNAPSGTDAVPSFNAIARNPQNDADQLTVKLATPHPAMPDFQLSTQTIEDLVAYFGVLGGQ